MVIRTDCICRPNYHNIIVTTSFDLLLSPLCLYCCLTIPSSLVLIYLFMYLFLSDNWFHNFVVQFTCIFFIISDLVNHVKCMSQINVLHDHLPKLFTLPNNLNATRCVVGIVRSSPWYVVGFVLLNL